MQKLKWFDLVALGFMTFALFLGAGNIIFPPLVGQLAGEHFWPATIGFLLTGVGLPLLTIVVLAHAGGGLEVMTAPVGRVAGTIFGIMVYLAIGPFFASPRTATVSFEIGFARYFGDGPTPLAVYSVAYFALVILIALFPGRLIENIGKCITPVLLVALALLGGAAWLFPAGSFGASSGLYREVPLAQGFLQGYQTMDALAALVFGIVVLNAIKDRRVTDRRLQTQYTTWAAIIAATGLALVYVSLTYLGGTSGMLAPNAETGVPLLAAYTLHAFGPAGGVLLTVVITLACLTTAVGLMAACGEFFSPLLRLSYRTVVIGFSLFSMVVANLGLAQLIAVSIPVLVGMYPVSITLVLLNLVSRLWTQKSRVFVPTLAVAAVLGILDGLTAAKLDSLVPDLYEALPGAAYGLGWLVPVLVVAVVCGSAVWLQERRQAA